jgi:hypothetical protein
VGLGVQTKPARTRDVTGVHAWDAVKAGTTSLSPDSNEMTASTGSLRGVGRWKVMVAVVLAGSSLACSAGADEVAPAATLGAPESEPTEVATVEPVETDGPIDTATVPTEIDAAYLNAVMADLDAALGDIYRDVRRAGQAGEAYEAAMRAVFTDEAAAAQSQGFRRAIGLKGLAPKPGDPKTRVREILEVHPREDPACIYFTATRDLDPLLRRPLDAEQPYYLALSHESPTRGNPTTWLIALDTFYPDGDAPRSVCGAST